MIPKSSYIFVLICSLSMGSFIFAMDDDKAKAQERVIAEIAKISKEIDIKSINKEIQKGIAQHKQDVRKNLIEKTKDQNTILWASKEKKAYF